METKPSMNSFQEVHAKVKAAKEKLRQAHESATDIRKKDAEEEAAREGFDRTAADTPDVQRDKTAQ